MGIPVRKRGAVSFDSPYGDGDSPFLCGDVLILLFILGSPYGNGEPFLFIAHMETGISNFHMGMFCSIPVSIRKSPYGNGEPNLLFPIWKLCSPFPYGDPQIHIVIPFMEINYASKGTSELLSIMLIPNTMNKHSHDP